MTTAADKTLAHGGQSADVVVDFLLSSDSAISCGNLAEEFDSLEFYGRPARRDEVRLNSADLHCCSHSWKPDALPAASSPLYRNISIPCLLSLLMMISRHCW